MTETRKLRLSWQMKVVTAVLVVAPIASLTTSVVRKSAIPSNSRGIASVGAEESSAVVLDSASMDLSDLSTNDLKKTFKYQLLREAHATRFKDSLSLTLGLFMVRNESGAKVYACDRYPQIEITMKTDKAQRTFQSECRVSDDMNHIEAVSLETDNPARTAWHITGLRLISDKKDDSLEINSKDLHAVIGSDIAVEEIH